MLVEIILASVISMIVAYFVIDLTIKLKNKNDDLLVKTLVYTDQAIIYNAIMDDIYNSGSDINCDYIDDKISIDKENNVFKYGEFTNVVSEYAEIGDYRCEGEGASIKINIPMEVKQLPDDNFNVIIGDVAEYLDTTPPILTFDITQKNGNYYAVMKCYDDECGIVGDEITEKQLVGDSNVNVEHSCTNGVGLSIKTEYEYKYLCKNYGSQICNTCYKEEYVCDDIYIGNKEYSCGGIIGCARCHKEDNPYSCNCYIPCLSYGFDK